MQIPLDPNAYFVQPENGQKRIVPLFIWFLVLSAILHSGSFVIMSLDWEWDIRIHDYGHVFLNLVQVSRWVLLLVVGARLINKRLKILMIVFCSVMLLQTLYWGVRNVLYLLNDGPEFTF